MRKIIAILLLFCLVISPVLASGSAVDIEGTTDDSNIMCGDHKCDYYEYVVKYAAKQQDAKDCPAAHYLQPSVDTATDRLEKDSIFFFHGHCIPGRIGVAENKIQVLPPRWIFAKNGKGEKALENLVLTNVNFAFFDCCESAGDDPLHGNLIKVAVNRGTKCAFGFRTDVRNLDPGIVYGQIFWDRARKGDGWTDAHKKALDVLKNDPRTRDRCEKQHDTCGYGTLTSFGGDVACNSALVPNQEANETAPIPIQLPETAPIPIQLPETANITLDQAQAIIRDFTGNPTLNVTYEKSDYERSRNSHKFVTDDADYYVNSVTHHVESIFHRSWSNLVVRPGQNEVDLDGAYAIAEQFAKKHYPQLWETTNKTGVRLQSKERLDHSLDPENPAYEYAISWSDEYYYPDKNTPGYLTITGLNYIDISVTPGGEIDTYYERLTPRDESVSLKPDLTEEQAWEIAKKYFLDVDNSELTDEDRISLGLDLMDFSNPFGVTDGKQTLTWHFSEKNNEEEHRNGGDIAVDAHDGHVVLYSPYG